MKLKAFIKVTHEEVDSFEAWWIQQRAAAAKSNEEDQWPLEMNEGDWYEQFMMWEASSAKDE